MTTAVRPKSGLDWAIEVPECVDKNDPDLTVSPFNSILYLIAAGARFGWTKIPKSLSLTEQALIANFRSLVDNDLKHIHPDDTNENVQQYITALGRTLYFYARIAQTNPEVGHFIGSGKNGNDDDADRWLHAGH
jgi:hypothetical protein